MTAEPATNSSPAPSGALPESDWTDQVTDLVVHLVDSTRARTTGPILKLARVVVYGVVALVVLAVVGVLSLVLIGRSLSLIPVDIWVSYLGLGALFTLSGLFLWSHRKPRT